MKTRKNIYFKVVALAVIAIAFAMPAKAQLSDNGYANIDWQFNAPLSNHFADKASGWGMNFEGGYFVTPNIGLGLFLNYHSNHEYVGRETFKMAGGDVSAKLGAEYAKVRSNFNMLEARDNSWGFYASPEIGINVFPWVYGPGLHFALYYSYGTNKADVLHYSVDGLSNFGFRLGLSF